MEKQERPRRGNGEGGLRFRPDRQVWEASFDLGPAPNGKRRRRVLSARSKPELLRRIADLRSLSGGAIKQAAQGTVGEFLKRWLSLDVEANKRPKTVEDYRGAWAHAQPVIGDIRLERFEVESVDMLYDALRTQGASANTIRRVGKVMHTAFEAAIRRRAYTRTNPFGIVERPAHRAADARALNIAEVRCVLKASQGDRYAALWILLITAGLRIGEALALRWSDVDLAKGTIAIRQSATDLRGRVVIGETKTHRSRRRVDLGALAVAALHQRRADCEGEDHSSELVFSTRLGTPLLQANLRRSHFYPILQRAGLGRVRLHDLRHTMTSLGVAAGISSKILAERLGHTTTRLTEDRYAHVLPGLQAGAAALIDDLIAEP